MNKFWGEALKRATATIVAAALVFTTPGLAAAGSVAGELSSESGKPVKIGLGEIRVIENMALPVAPVSADDNAASAPAPLPAPVEPVTPSDVVARDASAAAETGAALEMPAAPAASRSKDFSFARLASVAALVGSLMKPSLSSLTLKGRAGRGFENEHAYHGTPVAAQPAAVYASSFLAMGALQGGAKRKAGDRGPPPGGKEPPSGSGGNGGNDGPSRAPRATPRWVVVSILGAVAALNALVFLYPAAAVTGLHALAIAGYVGSNIMGFVFPLPQKKSIIQNRSADISSAVAVTGGIGSGLLGFNHALLGNRFASIQNYFGMLDFGFILWLKSKFSKESKGAASTKPSDASSWGKAIASSVLVASLAYLLGAGMTSALRWLPHPGWLKFLFQGMAASSFSYLMLPQYLKIRAERSVGDAHWGMAFGYWLATLGMGIFALDALVQGHGAGGAATFLKSTSAAANLKPLVIILDVALPLFFGLIHWLGERDWRMPERIKAFGRTIERETLINAASFLALAPVMFGSVAAAYFALSHRLSISDTWTFATYLLYMVENTVALVVTTLTLRAFWQFPTHKGADPPPPKDKLAANGAAPNPSSPRDPSGAESRQKGPKKPLRPGKYIYENWLGFRKIIGLKSDPNLKPLSYTASTEEIIDQISRQFSIDKAKLLKAAEAKKLYIDSPREKWFAVYDRLQKFNAESFKMLDHAKYRGWSSFRELANLEYGGGRSGALWRAAELHKILFGMFVRFPYHLFDSFFFGYFRQAMSFEFFHSTEDFLNLKTAGEAEKWLDSAFNAAAETSQWVMAASASLAGRLADHWLIRPLLLPLSAFMTRRFLMAAASYATLGGVAIAAHFVPFLMAVKLTAIPYLGPGLVYLAYGLPWVASGLPIVGPLLANVFGKATTAYLNELVVGKMINTFSLSFWLTTPHIFREQLFKLREKQHDLPPWWLMDGKQFWTVAKMTATSWEFYSQNLLAFFNMQTVNPEIVGILEFTLGGDAAVSAYGFHRLTGHDFRIFNGIASFVEGDKTHSISPWGGAIGWGTLALDWVQGAAHHNLSNDVMHLFGVGKDHSAQEIYQASIHRPGSEYQFDPELYKKSPAEVEARLTQLAAQAGDLGREIDEVMAHSARLEQELRAGRQRLDQLKAQSRPVTAAEKKEYDRILKDLEGRKSEANLKAKLSQMHDLKSPQARDLATLKQVQRLMNFYAPKLLERSDRPGMKDELSAREAETRAFYEHLTATVEGRAVHRDEGEAAKLDRADVDKIEKKVKAMEDLRVQWGSEMANNHGLRQLVGVENTARNAALKARRDPKDQINFYTQTSRWHVVSDIAFSERTIASAESNIQAMQNILAPKVVKINSQLAQSQQDLSAANSYSQQLGAWTQQAIGDLSSDKTLAGTVADYTSQTALAASRVGAFQTDIENFIAAYNAAEGGQSGDAAAEQTRLIGMLPQVAAAAANDTTNPLSIASLKADLVDLSSKLNDVQTGINTLPSNQVATEDAIAVILKVPGPATSLGSNPQLPAIIQAIKNHQTYWQGQRAKYQPSYDQVKRMMDPSNPNTVNDPFGRPHPESVIVWESNASGDMQASQTDAFTRIANINQMAQQINAVIQQNGGTGSVPLLPTGPNSLSDLQSAVKSYGTTLKSVRIPTGDTSDLNTAKMNLITIVANLGPLGKDVVKWSEDNGIINQIEDAKVNTLQPAATKLGAVMTMFDKIQADGDIDIKYVSGTDNEAPQDVINRKLGLLQGTVQPALQGAQDLIQNILIPYQNKTIASYSSTGDFFRLFDGKRTLISQITDAHDKQIPWALASFGAAQGDTSGAAAKVFQTKLLNYLNGFNDTPTHHQLGVNEYLNEIKLRTNQDPNATLREADGPDSKPYYQDSAYPGGGPYSLYQKITLYTGEEGTRAGEINAYARKINDIEAKIESSSGGKYNLTAYRLPINVTGDDSGAANLQTNVVNPSLIQNLRTQLTAIGDAAKGGTISFGSTDATTPPQGVQPQIALPNAQYLGDLALQAGKFLAQDPDPAKGGQSPLGYSVARLLYANKTVVSSRDNINNQIPAATTFLNAMQSALSDSSNLIGQKFLPYVANGGSGLTPAQVYTQSVGMFTELNGALAQGAVFFPTKVNADQNTINTITNLGTYYNSLNQIASGGITVDNDELQAIGRMQTSLQNTLDGLEKTRTKLNSWMKELNSADDSAPSRVAKAMMGIQEKTRAVLEENIKYQDLKKELDRSDAVLKAKFNQIEDQQESLRPLLKAAAEKEGLPDDLVARIEKLRMFRGSWADASAPGQGKGQTTVISKADFGYFLDAIMDRVKAQNPTEDISQLKNELLANPQELATIVPNSKLVDFGDNADGFYLFYQTQFAVPNGLNTGSAAMLGNFGKIGDSNLSALGYGFGSPPYPNNAPYGDKGIDMRLESLEGDRSVNYLDVDFHRYATNIPPDMQFLSGVKESRLMIFEDRAVMLLGDRLYMGFTGFADGAVSQPGDKPFYAGGAAKESLKMTEVMSLDADQVKLFSRDPRTFLQKVNLDFTGYDPDLNHTFDIQSRGKDMDYSRFQIGPKLNLARFFDFDRDNAFTVDLYYAHAGGTEDVTQQSGGLSVLKGFSIRDDNGKSWMMITNKATGELGTQYNTLSDKVSVSLPNHGVVISAEGKLVGAASTFYTQASKQITENTHLNLGYGSPFIGMNDRLSLSIDTSFSLGDMWNAVTKTAADELKGGENLKDYQGGLDNFFADQKNRTMATQEIMKAFEQDVAGKLITEDIGVVAKDIGEARKAGWIFGNTKIKGMIGLVSNPVSNDQAERATTAGVVAGSQTEFSISKTQTAFIKEHAAEFVRLGIQLRDHKIEMIKKLQGMARDLAQAGWQVRAAELEAKAAPAAVQRQEGEVKLAAAQKRFRQALLTYNAATGRGADEPNPFANMTPADVAALSAGVGDLLQAPDSLTTIMHSLDEAKLRQKIGFIAGGDDVKNPMNVLNAFDFLNLPDAVPGIERIGLSVGLQLQDMMASQLFTVGGSVRISFYNPRSDRDEAYLLEGGAALEQIKQIYADERLNLALESEQAKAWDLAAQAVKPHVPAATDELAGAIRAYRAGAIPPSRLREAYDRWQWYVDASLDAESRAAVAHSAEALDKSFVKPAEPSAGAKLTAQALDSSEFEAALGQISHPSAFEKTLIEITRQPGTLTEFGLREQSADAMTRANSSRIQKAFLDLHVGLGLTATGDGLLPEIGVGGLAALPIFGFEIKPADLRDLQVAEASGEKEYYHALRSKIEMGMAERYFQNLVNLRMAEEKAAFVKSRIDGLRAQSGPEARRQADAAETSAHQLDDAAAEARATMNYLIGKPADAPIAEDLTLEEGLAGLSRVMTAANPVATQKTILDTRVRIAREAEAMADQGLKIEQLYLEPISLGVRSLGRLIDTLANAQGNPDLVNAARAQTALEERAQEGYARSLATEGARARSQLALAELHLKNPEGKTEIERELARIDARGQIYALKARIASLTEPAKDKSNKDKDEETPQTKPSSFAELRNRLVAREQVLLAKAPDSDVEILSPDVKQHQALGLARYYHAFTTLGRARIDRDFLDVLAEVRFKADGDDAQTLIDFSRLRKEIADQKYRNDVEGAAAQADIVSARFESDVMALRAAEDRLARGAGEAGPELTKFIKDQKAKLDLEHGEIAAILNLDPQVTAQELINLVPRDPEGARDTRAIGEEMIARMRSTEMKRIQTMIFDGGLALDSMNAQDQLNQLKADNIARNMSLKGFTPVLAAGFFRAQPVGMAGLDAPDPILIQKKLETLVPEVLRQQLVNSGELKTASLKLQLDMARMQDDIKLVEARSRMIAAAEGDYRAQLALHDDPASPEVKAARERLVSAWTELSQSVIEAKNDWITVVAEFQAIGQGAQSSSYLASPKYRHQAESYDDAPLRRQPTEELLAYWSERLLSSDFEAGQNAMLAQISQVAPEAKERLRAKVAAYRQAVADSDEVRRADFTTAERLDLLAKADAEGRRQAVEDELAPILAAAGRLDPKLVKFFQQDVAAQAELHHEERLGFEKTSDAARSAFWKALRDQGQVPFALEGEFERLVKLDHQASEARQDLLRQYLTESDENPDRFVLKDLSLDRYLSAQHNFDAELMRLLGRSEVKSNPRVALVIDGLFGIRPALERLEGGAQAGRGRQALDALIMLEETRLSGARYAMRPPEEISRIAQALQKLKLTKERWADKSAKFDQLEPLYAAVKADGNGRHAWSVDGWYTKKDIEAKDANKLIEKAKDGRTYLKSDAGTRSELIGGVDAAQADRDTKADVAGKNKDLIGLGEKMAKFDFVTLGAKSGEKEGYSYNELFGKEKGNVYFFKAPRAGEPSNLLHYATLPISRQNGTPADYSIFLYTGKEALAPGRFPTQESLLSSPEFKDFREIKMGPGGARQMIEARRQRAVSDERRGWVRVKLDSYGFAVGASGVPSEIYTTADDFKAAIKAFKNVDKDLSSAQDDLKKAEVAKGKAEQSYAAAQKKFQEGAAEYDRVTNSLEREIADQVKEDFPRHGGETGVAYAVRTQIEVKHRLAEEGRYKDAQKASNRAAKAVSAEFAKVEKARADAINAEKAVQDEKLIKTRSLSWRLFLTEDLALGFDEQGMLAQAAEAKPVYGSEALDHKVGAPAAVKKTLGGAVLAVELGKHGALVKDYENAGEVDRAAAGWTIKSVSIAGAADAESDDGKTIKTNYRLSHYEDPATGAAVLLNSRYLISRADAAKSALRDAKYWGVLPWHWGSMLMEIPRGAVQTPAEIFFGVDPTHAHYLGRVRMYANEGGATEHYGFFRKAVNALDVLDFLPDQVQVYRDPSQMPEEVRVAKKISPDSDLFSSHMRAGNKDIHLGAGAIERRLNWINKDLENTRLETLSLFEGGVEKTFVATMRGRAGAYEDPTISITLRNADPDQDAVEAALKEPLVAQNVGLDGSGETLISGRPETIDVDAVNERLRVHLGVVETEQQARALGDYAAQLTASEKDARGADKGLRDLLRDSESAFAAEREDAAAARARERVLWDKEHALAWRMGAQKALENEMKRLESRIVEIRTALKWWPGYSRRLEEKLGWSRVPDWPLASLWVWLFLLFAAAALAAAVIDSLRRR